MEVSFEESVMKEIATKTQVAPTNYIHDELAVSTGSCSDKTRFNVSSPPSPLKDCKVRSEINCQPSQRDAISHDAQKLTATDQAIQNNKSQTQRNRLSPPLKVKTSLLV